MTRQRRLVPLAVLVALALLAPATSSSLATPAEPGSAAAKKRKKCKKGYVRKTVRNKKGKKVRRCVKKKKRGTTSPGIDTGPVPPVGTYTGAGGAVIIRITSAGTWPWRPACPRRT